MLPRVKSQTIYLDGADHAIALEMLGEVAEEISKWLKNELEKWHDEVMGKKEQQPPFEPDVLNPLSLEKLLEHTARICSRSCAWRGSIAIKAFIYPTSPPLPIIHELT